MNSQQQQNIQPPQGQNNNNNNNNNFNNNNNYRNDDDASEMATAANVEQIRVFILSTPLNALISPIVSANPITCH